MDNFTAPAQPRGWRIILMGIVIGAILGGVLLWVAVDVAWVREQRAMEREIRESLANEEDDAGRQAIIKHKAMPIAAAMGFFKEFGGAVVLGGGIGGVLAAKWRRRTKKPDG